MCHLAIENKKFSQRELHSGMTDFPKFFSFSLLNRELGGLSPD